MSHGRKYVWMFFLLAVPLTTARADDPKEAFAHITQCIRKDDSATCRKHITAGSHELYDRFVAYGLMSCLPKDTVYVSQEPLGNRAMIHTSIMTGDKKRFVRLVFAEEAGQWKLDIPDSLQVGLGNQWQQQINMTEQLYLLMKQQLGPGLNCNMLQELAKGARR